MQLASNLDTTQIPNLTKISLSTGNTFVQIFFNSVDNKMDIYFKTKKYRTLPIFCRNKN